jgi:hypothetical protein
MNGPIIINGITYNSPDEMPPDVRAQYEALGNLLADQNQNGMPDIVERAMQNGATVMQTSAIVYDGKTYACPDDLPPDARAKYKEAMAQLADRDQNGTPDVLENEDAALPVKTSPPPAAAPPREGQNMGPIVVLTVVAFGLVAILAIMLFLLSARAR